MSRPYFQKTGWPVFIYQGQRYDLGHLDEYVFSVNDSRSMERRVVVTFSDHCFTQNWVSGDGDALIYPQSSREPGCFSLERYQHSLQLRTHIERAVSGPVWHATGNENYAIVPTITQDGRRLLYAILFSLDRITGLPVDLHMRVRSAYPCDRQEIATFGSVRFQHLITLRLQGNQPKKMTDRRRKRPRIT